MGMIQSASGVSHAKTGKAARTEIDQTSSLARVTARANRKDVKLLDVILERRSK